MTTCTGVGIVDTPNICSSERIISDWILESDRVSTLSASLPELKNACGKLNSSVVTIPTTYSMPTKLSNLQRMQPELVCLLLASY